MLRRTPLKRRKRVNPVNPERREREWARAYHSIERVFFVSTVLAPVGDFWAVLDTHNENAHIETGGTGRKADYTKIVPMTPRQHRFYHQHGRAAFEERYGVDLDLAAADTQREWELRGADVVARAKADGRFDRWLARRNPPESTEDVA